MPFQMFDFNTDTALLGHIHHVKRNDHRHIHFKQLSGEIKIALQIGGIDHVNDYVGRVEQDVLAGYLFVGRKR